MKLKLKALAVASAMLFASGAFAAINNAEVGTTANTPGDYAGGSDLIFYAYTGSGATGKSYVQDLGVGMGAFLPASTAANTTTVFSILNGTAYGQLVAAGGTINWGVAAVHSNTTGPFALGMDYLFTTVNNSVTAATLANQTDSGIKNAVGVFDNFANYSATTTGGYYDSNPDLANWATNLTSKIGPSSLTFSAVNGVNASGVRFQMCDTPDGTSAKNTSQTAFAGTFGFDGSALTYTVTAAVPEPGTYAMLLAGLMMIGGIARRRTQG